VAKPLPAKPSLERLRREARALQRACLAGDADATQRLAFVFPDADVRRLPVTRAQAVVAREYGLASWPALKAEVEARRAPKPKSAAAVDAEALAERWFELAEAGELRALGRALAIGKHRKEAARAVMRASPNRYVAFQQALVGGLASPRDRIRFGCAAELDQFGDASTREPLARLMEDRVPRVRWMAMHALSCHACGEKTGPLEDPIRERIIAAALGDPSVHVRRHAAVALALAHETRAAPVLRQMMSRETDRRLLVGVAWALSELTRPAKPGPAGV
jgi:hypothetical protein